MEDGSEASGSRSREQAAFLNILKTADLLEADVARLLKPQGLSPTQYNVLRILRAAGSGVLPCGKVAGRMLTRDPDVTRLLDRLEKRSLIRRERSTSDRRVVIARISASGTKVLSRLEKPVLVLHREQLGHLRPEELRQLARLLRRTRGRAGARTSE